MKQSTTGGQPENECGGDVEAELELENRKEWFRVMVSSIGDAVLVTDTQARIVFLNPAAEALTGWLLTEAKGRAIAEVFQSLNEETRKPAQNPVEKALEEGRVVGLANHTILVSKNGTERAIDDSAAPIVDTQGRLIGVVLVFRDITEQRRAEMA